MNSLRWRYKQLFSKSTPILVVGYISPLEVQPYTQWWFTSMLEVRRWPWWKRFMAKVQCKERMCVSANIVNEYVMMQLE